MKTLVAALLLALGAGGAWADPLEGLWRTAPDVNGHVGLVRIAPCGPALCGTLVEATDASGARWTSPDLGRQVIWDTVPQGARTYRGRVYSPGRNAEYGSRLTLSAQGLLVEGCMLGQCRGGSLWQRVD